MEWKPIVAGVDASDEGVRAAQAAVALAQAASTECYLVHAVRDPATEVFYTEIPLNFQELRGTILDSARTLLTQVLRGKVPDKVIDKLECRFGSPGVVMSEVADERDAELIVLGGKHHTAVGRWLAGSTVHHMVRTHDRPILVNGPPGHGEGKFSRVLLAVDLSHAAKPTIDAAERIAGLFNAKVRAIHSVEPVTWVPELPPGLYEDMLRESEEQLERSVWPAIEYPGAEHQMRRGSAPDTIAAAAAEWNADLVVVGTHGRGWVDRVLIGSVTERLLNRLPTSMLIIPVTGPAPKTTPAPATKARAAKAPPAGARR
jgi:nucleotide-binding universal stress UspA family protein